MKRRLIQVSLFAAALIAFIEILNLAGVGFLLRHELSSRKQYSDLRNSQKRVHVTFKTVDQDGKPAPFFTFKVKLHSIAWYYGLLPQRSHNECFYIVKTDKEGVGRLQPFLQSAYEIQIEELPNDSYVFAPGKSIFKEAAEYCEDDPVNIPFLFQGIERTGQLITLRVLRHDPPAVLTRFSQKLEVMATNDNVFTVDFMGRQLFEGRQKGDLLVTIRYAQRALEFCQDTRQRDVAYKEGGGWEVELEGLGGTSIQQAENQYMTFAPESGYVKTVKYLYLTLSGRTFNNHEEIYKVAAPIEKATGFSLGYYPTPALSTPTGQEYHRLSHVLYFNRGFYLHNESDHWYGGLALRLDLSPQCGNKVTVAPRCDYNPTGSTNLWPGQKAVLWAYN